MKRKWYVAAVLLTAAVLSYMMLVKPQEKHKETDNAAENKEQILKKDNPKESNMEKTKKSVKPIFQSEIITDRIKAKINGLSYPKDCKIPYEDLRYLRVSHVDFEGRVQTGELICNKAIADDLLDIFKKLYAARYPIERLRLIDEYGANDEKSMSDNNSSCFCYRTISGSNKISKHGYGLAVDINPLYNPYVVPAGKAERVEPAGAVPYTDRSGSFSHKIDHRDLCYKLFREHGFSWGGDWKSRKDYQHFEKELTD